MLPKDSVFVSLKYITHASSQYIKWKQQKCNHCSFRYSENNCLILECFLHSFDLRSKTTEALPWSISTRNCPNCILWSQSWSGVVMSPNTWTRLMNRYMLKQWSILLDDLSCLVLWKEDLISYFFIYFKPFFLLAWTSTKSFSWFHGYSTDHGNTSRCRRAYIYKVAFIWPYYRKWTSS